MVKVPLNYYHLFGGRKPRNLSGNREQKLRFAERGALLWRVVPHSFMGCAGGEDDTASFPNLVSFSFVSSS